MPRPPGLVRRFLARNPWVVDAALVGGFVLAALLLLVASAPPPVSTPAWIPLILLASGAVVLLLRNRLPLTFFVVAALLTVITAALGTGVEIAVAVVALHTVGSRRRATIAWLAMVGAAGLSVVTAMLLLTRAAEGRALLEPTQPPVTDDFVIDVVNTAVILFVPFLIAALLGTNAGQRRRYIAALVDRAAQLARERDQQAELARAGERERIAREMHDVIAHSVSVMIALSEGAAAASDRPDVSRDAMTRVAETGRRTLTEVRRLLGGVRGEAQAALAPQPGAGDLAALVDEFQAAGLPVTLSVHGEPSTDPAAGLAVYRIVQESLTNVLRHAAEATAASVDLRWDARGATVIVADDGAPSRGGVAGRGLVGMRERAALFDGSVEAGPGRDGGWTVAADLRWEKRQ